MPAAGRSSRCRAATLPARGTPMLSVHGAVKRFGGLVAVNDVSFDVARRRDRRPDRAQRRRQVDHVQPAHRHAAADARARSSSSASDIAGLPQRAIARLRHGAHLPAREAAPADEPAGQRRARRPRAARAPACCAPGLRLDRAEERAILHEAQRQLERIGLGDRAHELAGSLPLGTQRILEIARALAADPVLLLLDEPAAGLRRKEKQALADLLRKLRDEGVTILIVEHDMDFVMRLVDRLVVMEFGSKLVEGAPAAVQRRSRGVQAGLPRRRGA